MFLRSFLIASSFVFVAGSAVASTVTIDFTSGTTTGTETAAGPSGFYASVGTLSQGGFDVTYDYNDDGFSLTPGTAFTTSVPAVGLLSDCGIGGCGGYSRSLSISKAGGGTFGLDSVDVLSTYEGFESFATLTPFAADGVTLDFASTISAAGPILRPSLAFTGVKSDGSTVTVQAQTTSPANAPTSPSFNTFGPAQATFLPGQQASLNDLTQLSVTVATPSFIDLAGALGITTFGAQPEILDGLRQCGVVVGGCTIPGVGQFNFNTVLTGGRNDTLAVQIGSITLSTPTAVPLPATAVLLLAGLGLLGAARSRRQS